MPHQKNRSLAGDDAPVVRFERGPDFRLGTRTSSSSCRRSSSPTACVWRGKIVEPFLEGQDGVQFQNLPWRRAGVHDALAGAPAAIARRAEAGDTAQAGPFADAFIESARSPRRNCWRSPSLSCPSAWLTPTLEAASTGRPAAAVAAHFRRLRSTSGRRTAPPAGPIPRCARSRHRSLPGEAGEGCDGGSRRGNDWRGRCRRTAPSRMGCCASGSSASRQDRHPGPLSSMPASWRGSRSPPAKSP